jgi:hypothetical protein
LVEGRKEWILYPMSREAQALNSSYRAAKHREWYSSTLDKCPLPLAWRGIQQAGEVLFVPRLAVHATLNHSDTVGVTWRWNQAKKPFSEKPVSYLIPETLELEGRIVHLWNKSHLQGLVIAVYTMNGQSVEDEIHAKEPLVLNLIVTDFERAKLILGDLMCCLDESEKKLMRASWVRHSDKTLTLSVALLKSSDILVNGRRIECKGLKQKLIEAVFGDQCFNEAVRLDLCGNSHARTYVS